MEEQETTREQTLYVDGMHCNACIALITMELEEKGLADKLSSIKIVDGENKGEVVLSNVTAAQIESVKAAIDGMEQYSIIPEEGK